MFLRPGPTARGILKRLKKCAVPTVPVYDPELRPFVPPKFYKGPVEEEGAPLPSASTIPYTIPLSLLPPLSSLCIDASSHSASPASPAALASPPSPSAPPSPSVPVSPEAPPSRAAPLSPSTTSSTRLKQRTEELTDPLQALSQQLSTDPGEDQEPCPQPASLPDGHSDHAYSTPLSLSDGYYDHAYFKKNKGTEENDESPNQQQTPKPPPKRRGRPPFRKKVRPFEFVDDRLSNDGVGSPPDSSQLEQLPSHFSDTESVVSKELSSHERRSMLRRHYWTARHHFLRFASKFQRPRRAVMDREKIVSSAAKYVSGEFLDILRAELRLPPLKSVKNKQTSCSSNLFAAESGGDCRQFHNLTSFGPESLDDPQIFLSSLDGTNASTQVSCWQVSVPTAQNRAKVPHRPSSQIAT
ncbi:uncharacterized protein LOC119174442 isoform X2 [Rhipicephalus microplus]|nr:pollen-specific leucine-rich repeat extensin-like protein 2 isoform X2 [Rhipicephalus microplus]